ncbi:NAD-dependent epimerase/dehydratase family protein [Halococcus saccharolyticus]|uniref:Nucleoside-diphosphate-sugar epimerase n=1 Tax=Halococcus saccharolyticus DSM 5350 TaxID=1227455 RepID=M0MGG0_9EURY|nr:NAD-dependent epimerase/dehydratase family protein [Halococcus saccharolyticus]EMA44827.1 nucleoside-diphosphate-sugar epimerase [Halococcus saccharolyticus DSM 5350]
MNRPNGKPPENPTENPQQRVQIETQGDHSDDRPHAIVTGGAGFLGSHIVDALLDDGYRVTSLDNFSSGRPENHAHIETARFESVRHDVTESFPDFDRVDQIYSFASHASPIDFRANAIDIALTNSVGTNHALQTARTHDATIVLASTSEVYGEPEIHPQREEYRGRVNPRGVRAPYDESKRLAEALVSAYHRQHDVDARTVRIFNTYGPRMRRNDGRVIPNFVDQALSGEDLTVYGDGSQTRSFCYVSDLVSGIRALAEAPRERAAGAVVNLGSREEVTIWELAETILAALDTRAGISYQELPEDDPSRRRPDLTRAETMLDWTPSIDLETGIRYTVDSFRQQDELRQVPSGDV